MTAAETMDNPADLVNVALETLVKARRELPAFSTFDRLARRVRQLANRRLFLQIARRCPPGLLEQLEALLVVAPADRHSGYQRLKQLPRRPSLRHLQALLDRLTWMTSIADTWPILRQGSGLLAAGTIPAAERLEYNE